MRWAVGLRSRGESSKADCVMTTSKHILLLGGVSRSLVNFRGALIQQMLAKGHRVTACASDEDLPSVQQLKNWGAQFAQVKFDRTSMNPIHEIQCLLRLTALMRSSKPDVFIGYTIKPIIYGLLGARLAGVPRRYGLVTGLGYAFTEGTEFRRRLANVSALAAYKTSLRFADNIVFQNPDDLELFRNKGILAPHQRAEFVNGSGVDLEHFQPVPLPTGPTRFLMIARLLKDKGVREFAAAAKLVKKQRPSCIFTLVGPWDSNPASIDATDLDRWRNEGTIEYLGTSTDVRQQISNCHVLVLPSYREGTPRTVLEAMSMGRAVVATDVPGCRQAVDHEVTGLLVPPRNASAIAGACLKLALQPELMREMGIHGRNMAEQKFDSKIVSNHTLTAMNLL